MKKSTLLRLLLSTAAVVSAGRVSAMETPDEKIARLEGELNTANTSLGTVQGERDDLKKAQEKPEPKDDRGSFATMFDKITSVGGFTDWIASKVCKDEQCHIRQRILRVSTLVTLGYASVKSGLLAKIKKMVAGGRTKQDLDDDEDDDEEDAAAAPVRCKVYCSPSKEEPAVASEEKPAAAEVESDSDTEEDEETA